MFIFTIEPSPMNIVHQDFAPLNLRKIDVAETLHWKVLRSMKTLFPPSHRRTKRNCSGLKADAITDSLLQQKEKKRKEKTVKRKRSITCNEKGPRIRTNQSPQLVDGLSLTMLSYRLYRSRKSTTISLQWAISDKRNHASTRVVSNF